MRLFIGIELSEKIKDELVLVQNRLKEENIKGNYTRRENLHLTLHFIGEVSTQEGLLWQDVLTKLKEKQKKFTLKLGGLNRFSRNHLHILFANVLLNDGLKRCINNLGKIIEEKTSFNPLKRYSPHITLARECRLNLTIDELKEKIASQNLEEEVLFLTLFESKRVDGILKYLPKMRIKIE